jgi:CheY-like chemotaxis protein
MEIAAPFHVLLIEDSPDDRADIRQMLLRGSQRRYTFTEAETGSAALRALHEAANPPDCILLDFSLPDMNALDILA